MHGRSPSRHRTRRHGRRRGRPAPERRRPAAIRPARRRCRGRCRVRARHRARSTSRTGVGGQLPFGEGAERTSVGIEDEERVAPIVSPAAIADMTGTPPRSAARVRNASCSTCSRRPTPRGSRPLRQIEDHALATNWPSTASRPKTLTAIGRPSDVAPKARATPRRWRGASRAAVASTPSSRRATVTWSSVRRPPGEPKQQVDQGRRAEPGQEPRRDPDGEGGPERDRRHGADPDQPASDESHRPSQVRRGRHDHGGRHGDTCGQVDRRRGDVRSDRAGWSPRRCRRRRWRRSRPPRRSPTASTSSRNTRFRPARDERAPRAGTASRRAAGRR